MIFIFYEIYLPVQTYHHAARACCAFLAHERLADGETRDGNDENDDGVRYDAVDDAFDLDIRDGEYVVEDVASDKE